MGRGGWRQARRWGWRKMESVETIQFEYGWTTLQSAPDLVSKKLWNMPAAMTRGPEKQAMESFRIGRGVYLPLKAHGREHLTSGNVCSALAHWPTGVMEPTGDEHHKSRPAPCPGRQRYSKFRYDSC